MTTTTGGEFPKPTSLESLKRHAKRIRRELDIKHAEALEHAARMAGFPNYRMALKHMTAPQSDDASHPMPRYLQARSDNRRAWAEAVQRIPQGGGATWNDRFEISHVLHQVLSSGAGVCMLPRMGHLHFTGVGAGFEPETIDLMLNGSAMRICRPRRLELHRVPSSPAEDFLLLHLDPLPVTDVYGEERRDSIHRRGQEEVAVTPDGVYFDRALRDDGQLPDARLLVRFLRGTMMFISTGSLWRVLPGHDMGMHEREDPEAIVSVLEQLTMRTGQA